ncbi:hypothetical protein FY528_13595 [Hymenobacter lutimineralis]|uniref:Uncharacterized protein n=1 Tax=Hymenobacter lutimineralis TaxID=2606448 RepID=A0A5D6UWX4_9BACT|nr:MULTISPECIES: hypothetical protein [Hymenobacter]QIX63283.1 hypothetical protein HER32_19735 [Hymenobacter sp. BT18]TYZ08076.1 hypothetical protein FY528_13595 [Hymenobacter lutimineralis]
MKKLTYLVLGGALLTSACEQAQKTKETYDNLAKLKDAGENIENTLDAAKAQREEREKRGDTLSLPYKELQTYLPTSISGFTAGNPEGQSTKMGSIAFSTASREFTKDSVTIKTELMDYNGAHDLYQGAAAMFALGMESENDEELVKSTSLGIEGASGMENFHKKDGRAELTLTLGGRFLVKIEADKQKDLALVESVAKQIALDKLAKM